MTEKGLQTIKEELQKKDWKKNIKILGMFVPEPKKVCLYYYNLILSNKVGKMQIEAAYRHCCNLVMNKQGMSDEEINNYWWKQYNKKQAKKQIK